MSRKLITALVSSALIFSSISTSAWSANEVQRPAQALAVQTSAISKNEMPLPPGPAAGIQEAQGVIGTGLILIGLLSVAAIVGVLLLVDDDEDEASSTERISRTSPLVFSRIAPGLRDLMPPKRGDLASNGRGNGTKVQ